MTDDSAATAFPSVITSVLPDTPMLPAGPSPSEVSHFPPLPEPPWRAGRPTVFGEFSRENGAFHYFQGTGRFPAVLFPFGASRRGAFFLRV